MGVYGRAGERFLLGLILDNAIVGERAEVLNLRITFCLAILVQSLSGWMDNWSRVTTLKTHANIAWTISAFQNLGKRCEGAIYGSYKY